MVTNNKGLTGAFIVVFLMHDEQAQGWKFTLLSGLFQIEDTFRNSWYDKAPNDKSFVILGVELGHFIILLNPSTGCHLSH